MTYLRIIASAATLLVLAGCDSITGLFSHDCTSIALWAVSVTVVDSVSGTAIGSGAIVRVRDGAFVDSIVRPSGTTDLDSAPFGLAPERAGRYQVKATRSGYRDWNTSDVRVTRDACHVRTAILLARLVPAP